MKIPNLISPRVLGSKWDGLSPHLLASFYVVENKDGTWRRSESDLATVVAPLTEASLEMAPNWQSPFEAAGPETKAPALMAMLSSGRFQPVIEAAMGAKNNAADASAAQKKSADFSQFEGRTGITRLNSTQAFAGMPPMKIQNALFREVHGTTRSERSRRPSRSSFSGRFPWSSPRTQLYPGPGSQDRPR